MPRTIQLESVEQLKALLHRYAIHPMQIGIEGDDIVFWTQNNLPRLFFEAFTVDGIELDRDRLKVAIYTSTKILA